ncbi:MAG: oxygen-independent coproporphyrinogen III oxidase [Parvularculaceae bacterium]
MPSEQDMISKYGGAAPRYTSYPTAPHFHTGVDGEVYRRWLGALCDGEATSVYLHVPYCRQLCWYCGCNTRATQTYHPVADYVKTLQAEIALVDRALTAKPRVTNLHWGGGTPTILSGGDFIDIMRRLRDAFDFAEDADIAIEIDPRTLTESKADMLAEAGVTRASLGVQEFSEHVQAAINRRQSYQLVAKIVGMLRANGINALNFDLMYGLPQQTEEDVARSAALTAELRPNRIAVFGYAHVPWMKSHQQLIHDDELPTESERLRQSAAAAKVFEAAGYVRIGLDHFALPDDSLAQLSRSGGLRRNFQGYTDDPAEVLIGFGASAIGSFPQGYVQNDSNVRTYAAAVTKGALPVARGVEICLEDILRRAVIERLMCDFTTDLKKICARHDMPASIFEEERAQLEFFEQDGLVTINDDVIAIPKDRRQYVRSVCAVFDSYLKTGKARHSKAV